jgi:hypothetical protein
MGFPESQNTKEICVCVVCGDGRGRLGRRSTQERGMGRQRELSTNSVDYKNLSRKMKQT